MKICLCADSPERVLAILGLQDELRGRVEFCVILLLSAESPDCREESLLTALSADKVLRLTRKPGWRPGRAGRLRDAVSAFLCHHKPHCMHFFGVIPEALDAARKTRLPCLYSPTEPTGIFGEHLSFRLQRRERLLLRDCVGVQVESDLQEERILLLGKCSADKIVVIPPWLDVVPDEKLRPFLVAQDAPETPEQTLVERTPNEKISASAGIPELAARDAGAGLADSAWSIRRRQSCVALNLKPGHRIAGFVWPADSPERQLCYLEMAVRFCRLVKDVAFVIGGVDCLPPGLERGLSREFLESLRFLPTARADEFYQMLDVFFWAGYGWGVPMELLNAMSHGVAVVAEETPGTLSVVTHQESGIMVPGGGWAALASAGAVILQDGDQFLRLGAWAAVAVRERFHRVLAAKAWLRLYDALGNTQTRNTLAELFTDDFEPR